VLESELFGPGHFVGLGLGLRLKSEIRTRTRAKTQEIVTFLHLDPKLSVNENTYDVLTAVDICGTCTDSVHVVYKGNNRILRKKKFKFRIFFVKC
jgi:hypothetical protein